MYAGMMPGLLPAGTLLIIRYVEFALSGRGGAEENAFKEKANSALAWAVVCGCPELPEAGRIRSAASGP
jgi:hypothetical protein